jgi:hypothetical protein
VSADPDGLTARLLQSARSERASPERVERVIARARSELRRTRPATAPAAPPRRRRRPLWAFSLAALVAGGLGAVWLFVQPARDASLELSAEPGRRDLDGADRDEPPHGEDPRAPVAEPSSPAAPPVPLAESPRPPTSAPARAAPQPTPPTASPAARSLGDELRLLEDARSALARGRAADALAGLDRHALEFSRARLGHEATLLRIETLSAMGRGAEAVELARRFVGEEPDSPLADRARSFLPTATTPLPRVDER